MDTGEGMHQGREQPDKGGAAACADLEDLKNNQQPWQEKWAGRGGRGRPSRNLHQGALFRIWPFSWET